MQQLIDHQREALKKREEFIKTQSQKKEQIQTITEELLNKLNENYKITHKMPFDDSLSAIGDISDSQEIIDEKEMQMKLHQILHILNEQKGDQQFQKEMEEEERRVQSGELRDKFVQDIYEEASTEEAHIFMI